MRRPKSGWPDLPRTTRFDGIHVRHRTAIRHALDGYRRMQAPPEQPSKQDLPQVPQFRASRSVLTHAPLQSVSPALQLALQLPFTQLAEPFVGGVHARLQAPQCATLERISTQAEPQREAGATHSKPHWPPAQSGLAFAGAGQTWPHVPQFELSFWVLTQEPLHSLCVASQASWQLPPVQTRPPVQGALHRPQ
jgi:hypothetical protein